MKNIFETEVTNQIIERINRLTKNSQPQWGKMDVAQMLAHCSVTYELIYDRQPEKPKGFKLFLLKMFVKKIVVSEKPYKKNSRTAPDFLIVDQRVFDTEKTRLLAYLQRTVDLGAKYFDNKASHSFGNLSIDEWNNMFYKHLDHHLRQFGV